MLCAALLAGLLAAPASAADRAGAFTLSFRGISTGILAYAATESGGRYAASATLETTGLVALLRKVQFRASARGTVEGKRFFPQRYQGGASTGRLVSESVLDYSNGVPRLVRYRSPAADAPDSPAPGTQRGTIDPMTAIYAILREVPEADACDMRLEIFDGKRRSRVTLGPPEPSVGGLSCVGEYRRIAGFSARDMAEMAQFPFRLDYAASEGGRVRAVRGVFDTLYGTATLDRR